MTLGLLEVNDLVVEFELGRKRQPLRAVDGVSLSIDPGETIGLVGESGSGKTTLGRAILGLTPVRSGTIRFAGSDITNAGYRERRRLSSDLQVVFQDPYSSLNPARTIEQTLTETLRATNSMTKVELRARVMEMLERVGLPAETGSRYPVRFSGGQRQRIAIARALMANPRLVVCDEPVSALDLSVQAQVLNLLRDLQADLGLAYLFIAHDLDVVRNVSHRIVVLYRGRIMEQGAAADVYRRPSHPYTQALLAAAPVPDPKRQRVRRQTRPSSVGQAVDENACPFAPRCPFAADICRSVRPQLEVTSNGSVVACHRWRELVSQGSSIQGNL